MSGSNKYARCSFCQKERRTTSTGKISAHDMWDGKQMVPCPGGVPRRFARRK